VAGAGGWGPREDGAGMEEAVQAEVSEGSAEVALAVAAREEVGKAKQWIERRN